MSGEGSEEDQSIQDDDDDEGDRSPSMLREGRASGRQALIDLGIEADIVDSDPDLAQALAESILADRAAEREREALAEREEQERKKKEKEEEEKRKKREEQERMQKEA